MIKNKGGLEMIEKKSSENESCCSGNSGCCTPEQTIPTEKRRINIDFLYLDLSVCAPCQGAESILDEAIKDVANILELTGVEVLVNKVNVTNEEQAMNFKFVSSPTIRINGRDIQFEVKESSCQTCSDLSGEATDCRIWVYQGKEHNVPPKAMIIEAILKEVYGGNGGDNAVVQDYVMPENLKQFYSAMERKKQETGSPCCGASSSNGCCQ
jgi:hypothetical protein